MIKLTEDTRSQLISDSRYAKREQDGKTRYQKRVNQRLLSNVSNLNNIDFNQFFKENILVVNIDVVGQTDTYTVTISFGSVLDYIQREIKDADGELTLHGIIRALMRAFDNNDIQYRCNCPDFKYRQAYWLSRENVIYGQKETIPSDITNPTNDLGRGCKHIMAVISNNNWVIKLASVLKNYTDYIEKNYHRQYADIIYPALYGKKYEEPVQQDLFGDELGTDRETVSQANKAARAKGQFKKGNEYRFKPRTTAKGQQQMDFEDEDNKALSD